MSTMLPIVEPTPDFIGGLLHDQQSMSAIERFSIVYEASEQRGSPVQARYYHELLPAAPPRPGQQYAFEVDLDKCSGCKACVVACHTMNGLEEEEAWRRVGTVSAASDPGHVQHVTTACHHCEDPACLAGCPVNAYEKDPATGIVRHLDDQCIGCKYCTMMCPYEVPRYSERLGIVRKCDMCHQRLSAGEAPACVQACPNEAITIGVVDIDPGGGQQNCPTPSDPLRFPQHVPAPETRLAPGAPPSRITRPTTRYQTAHAASFAAANPQDAGIDPVAETHWPLAVMLVGTQISVGVLIAERLAAALMMLAGHSWPTEATRAAATIALVIGSIGLGLAPLHLGQPLRAWRVFLGLRTSWLSREAVILGKYMGLVGMATVLLWLKPFADHFAIGLSNSVPPWAADVTLLVAVVTGMAGLYSSAMIYIVTRRQQWRPARTLGRFFGTAALGGLAWTMPVVMVGSDSYVLARVAAAAVASTLLTKLIWEYHMHLWAASAVDSYDVRSGRLARGPLRRLTIARLAIGLTTVVAAAVFALAASPAAPVAWAVAAIAGAMLLAAGEMCERLLYFSSVVYDRMPGTLR